MFWIPMAIGAAAGALTNKDPLKGAVMGAGMGAATGGLGALGAGAGAAGAGATGAGAGANLAAMGGGQGLLAGTSAAGGLAGNAAQGLSMGAGGGGLLAGGAQGLTAAPGAGMALTSATQPAAASGLGGLLSKGNMQTVGDVAGLAQKAGVFNDPAAPQAQSAGIPGRGGVDFSGLLSAGRANNVSGAQLLAQQRAARRGA